MRGGGRYPQGVVAYESEGEGLAGVQGVGCEGVGEWRAEVVGGFAEEGGVELEGEVGGGGGRGGGGGSHDYGSGLGLMCTEIRKEIKGDDRVECGGCGSSPSKV